MRILGRTLVILAAALMVVGATFALAGSNTASPSAALRQQRATGVTADGASGQAQVGIEREGFPGGERHREGGGGLFGIVDVLGHFVIIAVIVVMVVVPQKLVRRYRPTHQLRHRPPHVPMASHGER